MSLTDHASVAIHALKQMIEIASGKFQEELRMEQYNLAEAWMSDLTDLNKLLFDLSKWQ
jgi:hypothetical protein